MTHRQRESWKTRTERWVRAGAALDDGRIICDLCDITLNDYPYLCTATEWKCPGRIAVDTAAAGDNGEYGRRM